MKTLKRAMNHYKGMTEREAAYKKELYKYGKIFDAHFDEFEDSEYDMLNRLNFKI